MKFQQSRRPNEHFDVHNKLLVGSKLFRLPALYLTFDVIYGPSVVRSLHTPDIFDIYCHSGEFISAFEFDPKSQYLKPQRTT